MKTETTDIKVIATNRKARYEYHISDSVEAGIALVGTEVKSIRAGNVNFQDAFAMVKDGELLLMSLHISPFDKGNIFNHDPVRVRKLLVHKKEIRRLAESVNEKGYTLIPLRIYLKGRRVKVEIGVAKGKKTYDKREAIKERDVKRELQRQYK
jgi:SsrA-binding protein